MSQSSTSVMDMGGLNWTFEVRELAHHRLQAPRIAVAGSLREGVLMKSSIVWVSILLVGIALATTAAAAQTRARLKTPGPPPVQDLQVLYDFRVSLDSKVELTAEAEQKILSALFPSHLADCTKRLEKAGIQDDLPAARAAGWFAPAISSTIRGSFTAPSADETAYLIAVRECNASHADNFGTKRLAVFAAGKPVANLEADQGDVVEILKVYDLNSDGVNELLVASTSGNMGAFLTTASLIEARGRQLRLLKQFDSTKYDDCESGFPGSQITASVILYAPEAGKHPQMFRTDNYRAKCSADEPKAQLKDFRYISTGKFPDEP